MKHISVHKRIYEKCNCILESYFKHHFSEEKGRIYKVHETAYLDLKLKKKDKHI